MLISLVGNKLQWTARCLYTDEKGWHLVIMGMIKLISIKKFAQSTQKISYCCA